MLKPMPFIVLLSCYLLLTSIDLYGQNVVDGPSWSPDGNRFVYVKKKGEANSDLFIYDFRSGNSDQLTYSDASEWTPAWSPDSRHIAFVSDRNGNRDVYVYSFESKKNRLIVGSDEREAAPSWSPDSKEIYFARFDTVNNTSGIYKVDLEGSVEKVLISAERSYIYPSVSPNNQYLLYASKRIDQESYNHIYLLDLITGVQKQIENRGLVSYNPSWSNNSETIYFINQDIGENKSAKIFRYIVSEDKIQEVLRNKVGCFMVRKNPVKEEIIYKIGWGEAHLGIGLFNLLTGENELILNAQD